MGTYNYHAICLNYKSLQLQQVGQLVFLRQQDY